MDSLKKGLQELNTGLNRAVRTLDRMLKAIEASEKATPDVTSAAKKPATKKAAREKTGQKKPAAKKAPARKTPRKKAAAAKKTAPKKTLKTAAKKSGKTSDTDTVVGIIRRSGKGVDIPTLMKKTGFDRRKIHNLTSKAAKKGKIEKLGRGVYAKGAAK